ncbi:MAG: fibronectin type III domain-containing protein, partial [Actinomycetota bacterium]
MLGDVAFFRFDGGDGDEPWISDGTVGGTRQLVDLNPGSTGSSPRAFSVLGDRMFFQANGGVYVSDGSANGTVPVTLPGVVASVGQIDVIGRSLVMLAQDSDGDSVFFHTRDPNDGFTQVSSDPAAPFDSPTLDRGIEFDDGRLLIPFEGDMGGELLYVIDGESVTTIDVNPAAYPVTETYVQEMVQHRGVAYFAIEDDLAPRVEQYELWSSDGTQAGTIKRFDVEGRNSDSRLNSLAIVDELLYFQADSVAFGVEPWILDVGPDAPALPSNVSAVAGDGSVEVSWTAPLSDGGAPIVGYSVTASPGGGSCSTSDATTCRVGGLTNGVSYTFTVTASNDARTSAPSLPSAAVSPESPVPDVVSLVPRRFLETRAGEVTFDGEGQLGRRVAGGETVRVQVTGRGGIAAGTSGVVANVTVVGPSGPGFVTVWDCVGDPPTASSLNYGPGAVVPNELVAKLSLSGELCLFTRAETDLLVDVVGLVPAESALVSLAPRRFFESRAGEVTFDGEGQPGARVGAGETVRVQVTGRGGIPAGTSGVIANVTVVGPSGPGFVTVWDCQGDPPTASSLNYRAGQVVPNELIAKLSPTGELCLFTRAET